MIWFIRPLALLLPLAAALPAAAQIRIKDIADVEGVRENQLVGYGLVVGLNNTGDKLDNAVFTRESLIGMLERLGVNTRDQAIEAADQEHRRGDGDRRTAGIRTQRQPDRCRGFGAWRRHQPDRRHAAGDAAAGRRWRGLCGGAGRSGHRGDRRAAAPPAR